jgi:hypothetical protein
MKIAVLYCNESYEQVVSTLNQADDAVINSKPADFWLRLCDPDTGWTIAHCLAHFNALPTSFSDYSLADKDGHTVAHSLASSKPVKDLSVNLMPANFPLEAWAIRNAFNEQVAELFISTHPERVEEVPVAYRFYPQDLLDDFDDNDDDANAFRSS